METEQIEAIVWFSFSQPNEEAVKEIEGLVRKTCSLVSGLDIDPDKVVCHFNEKGHGYDETDDLNIIVMIAGSRNMYSREVQHWHSALLEAFYDRDKFRSASCGPVAGKRPQQKTG